MEGGGDSSHSAGKALGNHLIQERIAEALSEGRNTVSFKSLLNARLIGPDWPQSVFKHLYPRTVTKRMNQHYGRDTISTFLDKVRPNAWIPLVLSLDLSQLDDPMFIRLFDDYSNRFVSMTFSPNLRMPAGLTEKLGFLKRRQYPRLQSLVFRTVARGNDTEEIQQCFDTIAELVEDAKETLQALRISFHNLSFLAVSPMSFKLPPLVTHIEVGATAIRTLEDRRNTFANLEELEVTNCIIDDPIFVELLPNCIQRCSRLKKLGLEGFNRPLNDMPLVILPVRHLALLQELTLSGTHYALDVAPGPGVLPELRSIQLRGVPTTPGDVNRLAGIGELLRRPRSLLITLQYSRNLVAGDPGEVPSEETMTQLCSIVPNATELEWWHYPFQWETMVNPLAVIFSQLIALRELKLFFYSYDRNFRDAPVDLTYLLTGTSAVEIPQNEEDWENTLDGRVTSLTNLVNLKSFEIHGNEFLPVGPFLFKAALLRMPNLKTFMWHQRNSTVDPFVNVQDMIAKWKASGREIFDIMQPPPPPLEAPARND